jgi:hypothetical protein
MDDHLKKYHDKRRTEQTVLGLVGEHGYKTKFVRDNAYVIMDECLHKALLVTILPLETETSVKSFVTVNGFKYYFPEG